MCGIAGYVMVDLPRGEQPTVLESMAAVIVHRGPDEGGFHREPGVQLAHRRLSIVDLSTGQQPMANEDGQVWIVYNGEIFNHASLRPELERFGHRYKTHCDTETIIHAWEQYGARCVERFQGMFAFALWDRNRKTLFCARDRLGKKPFYYWWDGQTFIFGSEIKALLEHPLVSAEPDESLFAEYLAFGYVSEERTMFKGIRKLMPGHHLQLVLDGKQKPTPVIAPYWQIPEPGAQEQRSDREWIQECRERLERSVEMRLMADVPLGMFLSGGLDSSAIAALMKRLTSTPVKTFAVGYAESAYSELGYAKQVAETIGTDHHEVLVSMDDFFNILPHMVWHEDEPITWPSSVPLYFCAKRAQQEVKVVLTGEGSDELFAGYARYQRYPWNLKYQRRYRHVPEFIRAGVRNQVSSSALLSGDLRRKLQHTFLGRDGNVESLYLDNFYSAFDRETQRSLFTFTDPEAPYRNFRRYWDEAASRPELARMLYADQKTYLVELLMKQDQMSMAASLESRVPFLDHTFVEFATRVPDSLKIRNGEGKYIVKKAVEDILPHDIIYRTKMGFPTPLRNWLMSARAEPLLKRLTKKDNFLAPHVRMPAVEALLERHRRGQEDCTDRIWRLLNLVLWGDVFFTDRRDEVMGGLMGTRGNA